MKIPLSILVSVSFPALASAQCLEWSAAFGAPGTGFGPADREVITLESLDLGSGAQLFAGGNFTEAGAGTAYRVARWSQSAWGPLGAGLGSGSSNTPIARAFAAYDSGLGPELYAGTSGVISRWNGTTWTPVPGLNSVNDYDLEVYDDGTGPKLFACGTFFLPGAIQRKLIYWNGASWTGIPYNQGSSLFCMTVFDAGSGPELFVGGSAGGSSLLRWNGTTLTAVAGAPTGIFDMLVHDDGSGPKLYLAGSFTVATGSNANGIVRWDGTSFSTLGDPFGTSQPNVRTLAVYDEGAGPRLFAGGSFSSAVGAGFERIARWDGTLWTGVGGGADNWIQCLAVHDFGAGPRLCAGGSFTEIGGKAAAHFSTWDGTSWGPVVEDQGVLGDVLALRVFDDGAGPKLWAGGNFTLAGESVALRLARFDGQGWSAAGDPDGVVTAFGVYDAGAGPELYVGGGFNLIGGQNAVHIARWDGAAWHALGEGLQTAFTPEATQVNAMAVFDAGSGPELYVGGYFTSAGTQTAFYIARWNGTSWSAVGSGANGTVRALAVFDEGSGPRLFCGGVFTGMGSVSAPRIARWDGSAWSDVGGGVTGSGTPGVFALASFDSGTGPELVAGGNFNNAGGTSAPLVARWNGVHWTAAGVLTGSEIDALTTMDDGAGPALYAGGLFTIGSGTNVGKWDAKQWSELGSGTSWRVWALGSMATLGGARDLYVGGEFLAAGGRPAWGLARWEGCGGAADLFCFGDGTGINPCPCTNEGAPKHGCENSAGTGGALLSASGGTSPDTLQLSSQGELPTALSIFLQGDVEIVAASFGDGLRCAGGSLKRLYAHNASAGFVQAPLGGELPITQRSAQLGDPFTPGAVRLYQVYYRDPSAGFCPGPQGNTWNISSAARVQW